jgi:catechol 2,3-dioxygenase-like lactoylglutathione lyase family enzyme
VPPRVNGVLETGIYVEDIERSRAFYERIFGFDAIFVEERIVTLAVAPAQVLIIFRRGGTLDPVPVGDSVIPPHDGGGPQHFAFAVAADDLEAWKAHLAAEGVAIESTVRWPKGGTSLYFRDPDGLLVELATPGLWANY